MATFRGRLGVVREVGAQNALFYATGGLAAADMRFTGGPVGDYSSGYTSDMTGWTAGVGVEVELKNNAKLRVEYSYVDLGSATGALSPFYSPVSMSSDVTQHVVRVGYRMDF